MDIILKINLSSLRTIKQNAQLVKEELQAKKLRGINVPLKEDFNLNIFFSERKELKEFVPN